ncbi:MAG: 3-hydroxyacyl-[acyl-carrier-protein] dehydratase FabZ [Vicinamibacteria bacterium]|jgi:3-hydroxyacyl-[acyl-carrier-protein] dehydratase
MSRVFDRAAIEKILPHRHPFLFVDEVIELVPSERVVGLVRIADNGIFLMKDGAEPYFPSTLLIEAMAQVGAILVLHPEENHGRTIYFRAIDHAEFHKKVPAGATVRIEGTVRRMRGRLGSLQMKAFLGDVLAAEGVMRFAL